MTTAIDLISTLRRLDGGFNAREQKVASYVLENLEGVTRSTVTQIAAASGVSEPTVIRFCRTLGCAGFKEFKIRLAQNVAVSLQYLKRTHETDTSGSNLIDHILGVLFTTANAARSQLDPAVIEAAIAAMTRAHQLVFCGVGGGSTTVAFDAASRFFRLGIPTTSLSDGYLQRMHAATLGEDDVLVMISASGHPRELVESAEIARQYGAKTIGLTHPDSPLAAVSDIAILLDLTEDPDIYKPTASRLVFLAVIDVLATGVARSRPDSTKEQLRRIRASLATLDGRTTAQPVGD